MHFMSSTRGKFLYLMISISDIFFGPMTSQNSNIQIPRDDGLRRGFDALDVEHTGEIPVEKFKERIRKVLFLLKATYISMARFTILIFATTV